MDTLPLVTLMFALIATGASIWMTIRAFKTNTGWGFAVLLLAPFSTTVFGIKHWDEQREPFLLFITTFTATFALSIYLFTVAGGMSLLHLTKGNQEQTLADNNSGDLMHTSYSVDSTPGMEDPIQHESGLIDDPGTSIMDTDTEAQANSENNPAAKKEKPVRYRLAFIPIKLSDAKNYIGATAKVTRKNVKEKEYRITGASHRHIELAQRGRGGQYSFHFKNSDVEKIRVLINEPY